MARGEEMDDEGKEVTFNEWWNDYLDEMRELGLSGVADKKVSERDYNRGVRPKVAAAADARFCATGEY
jgi:hypothetical protein